MSSPEATDPDRIEQDIRRHRENLAETVDELSDRLDVKAQARRRVESARAQVRERVDHATRGVRSSESGDLARVAAPVLAGVAVLALVAGIVRRSRR